MSKDLVQEISEAINRQSMENDSNTPDFILAEYLCDCLETLDNCSKHREKWYGSSLKIDTGDEI